MEGCIFCLEGLLFFPVILSYSVILNGGVNMCPIVAHDGLTIDLGNFCFGSGRCNFAHGWVVGLVIGWVFG